MHHLVGRAVSYLARRPPPDDLPEDLVIPAWAINLLVFSCVAYVVVLILITYTLGLVFVLACVETPQHAIVESNVQSNEALPAYRDADPLAGEEATDVLTGQRTAEHGDPEVLVMHQKPITTSIRRTIRLLTSVGGFPGRWRGFSLWIVLSFAMFAVTGLLGFLTPPVAGIIASILFCTWEMGWTHIVVSEPSPKYWYQRLPKFKSNWRKIWFPTVMLDLAMNILLIITIGLAFAFHLHDTDRIRKESAGIVVLKVIIFFLVWLLLWVFLIIPAKVALVRMQCCLLPQDEKTIVPVDRTFGQPIVSELDGGTGRLSYRGAWRSVKREALWRLIKLLIKTFFITFAICIVFSVFIGLEFAFIVAPATERRGRDGNAPPVDLGRQ